MTSDGPDRRTSPYATAKVECIRESGRQFDPRVVKAYMFIPEARFEVIRAETLDHVTNTRVTEGKAVQSCGQNEVWCGRS
jgi:HD-GYP domain-containing protein (c-di-GMP phosphodiesterase class II)